MSTIKVLALLIVSCLFSSITGALSGYYAAIKTPTLSNVAVLDFEAIAKNINPNDPHAMAKAAQMAQRTKQIAAQLTQAGMVVIDRANVIDAPQEAIIHVQPNEP